MSEQGSSTDKSEGRNPAWDDYRLWFKKAESLFIVADGAWRIFGDLIPCHPLQGGNVVVDGVAHAAFFLYGSGLENAIKGLLIYRTPTLVTDAKFWGSKIMLGHDLISLCKLAELVLAPQEKAVLLSFNAFLKWAGRYPVPLNKQKWGYPGTHLDNSQPKTAYQLLRKVASLAEYRISLLDVEPPDPFKRVLGSRSVHALAREITENLNKDKR